MSDQNKKTCCAVIRSKVVGHNIANVYWLILMKKVAFCELKLRFYLMVCPMNLHVDEETIASPTAYFIFWLRIQ